MVKQLLRESQRAKGSSRKASRGAPVSSSSAKKKAAAGATAASSFNKNLLTPPTRKAAEKYEDGDSVLTLPLELAVISPTSTGHAGWFSWAAFGGTGILSSKKSPRMEVVEDDVESTLTNEDPSIHSNERTRRTEERKQEDLASRYSDQSKNRKNSYIMDARAATSLIDNTDDSMTGHYSRFSNTSLHSNYDRATPRSGQPSPTIRPSQSRESPRNKSTRPNSREDSQSRCAEEATKIVRNTTAEENPVVTSKSSLVQDETWDYGPSETRVTQNTQNFHQNAHDQSYQRNDEEYDNGDGDDDDDDELDWSTTGVKPHRWTSTAASTTSSTSSGKESETSSVALVRKKWRAHRRTLLRNQKWRPEEDWAMMGEDGVNNVDWPGAAPRPRGIPTTTIEEEEFSETKSVKMQKKARCFSCSCLG